MSLSGESGMMTPKVRMHCTAVYGKSLGLPLNILGSVFSH